MITKPAGLATLETQAKILARDEQGIEVTLIMISNSTKGKTMKIPIWLTQFLTQIVQDGDWQHGDGSSMATDAQEFLASVGINVDANVNERDLVEIAHAPVMVTLNAKFDNSDLTVENKPLLLFFECGRIKFSIELDMIQFMNLLRSKGSINTTARFGTVPLLRVKDLKPMDKYIVLDVDTLGMPTIDKDGHVQSAAIRLAKK